MPVIDRNRRSKKAITDALATIGSEQSWWSRARCVEFGWKYPAKLFFYEYGSANRDKVKHEGYITASELKAKECCIECPVRRECLETALKWPYTVGIWGGTLERERAKTKHLPGCVRTTLTRCGGCRPTQQRITMLLEQMDKQAAG